MARVRWLWDQSPPNVDEHDFVPYPEETSKVLEESYSCLLARVMSCDVGGGRVVQMSQRNGLVQLVKEDPGRWRAVKREVLLYPDAIHVTTAARPAPPASSLPPAAPAPPPLRQMYPIFHQRAVTPPPALRAAGMPEPRSASPPARTGKKRDGDE